MANEEHGILPTDTQPTGSLYDYQKYGIEIGQVYVRADGAKQPILTVVDVETHAQRGEVVVQDIFTGVKSDMDAFKLAMVRYSLVPPSEVDEIIRISASANKGLKFIG